MSPAAAASTPAVPFERKSIFACSPATTRGQPVHLGGDPKGQNILYANGRTVIIRNLANPQIADEYVGHSFPVTCARYAPSGYYIASADERGNVRIWDCTQKSQILKNEFKVLAGKITDLSWDSESKRIIAVGDGRDKYGHAFTSDSGNSVGEISGHSKIINAVSIRNNRPFRAVTCSDDMTVNFYHGAPYKFNLSISDHTRFVQCVRFSPDGAHFVSVGMDGKIFLYDGATGAKVSEISSAENSHSGGIFSVSWSPDSKYFMTSSADTTVKIWDIEKKAVKNTFQLSKNAAIEDQQVGTLWQGQYLLSLSLNGNLNYLDVNSSSVAKVVQGHQKNITAFTKTSSGKLYTGSYDGKTYSWDVQSGLASEVKGAGPNNQVNALNANGSAVEMVSMDDTYRCIDVQKNEFNATTAALGSLPKSISSVKDTTLISTMKEIIVMKNGAKAFTLANPGGAVPNAVALNKTGNEAAIGFDNSKIHIYSIDASGKLEEKKSSDPDVPMTMRGAVTVISYSPDCKYVAAGDSTGKIFVYDASTKALKLNQWVFHSARVNSITWSDDSLYAVSGSLDTNIYVWSVERPMKHVAIKSSHTESVNGVQFLDKNTIVSVGNDSCVKTWQISTMP